MLPLYHGNALQRTLFTHERRLSREIASNSDPLIHFHARSIPFGPVEDEMERLYRIWLPTENIISDDGSWLRALLVSGEEDTMAGRYIRSRGEQF